MLTTDESVFLDHLLDRLESLHKQVDALLIDQGEVLHRLDLIEACDNPLPYTSEDHRGF